jgi:hypothetical protein
VSQAELNDQCASLESLIAATKQLAKDPSQGKFYPHIHWWTLERHLKLVRRGAIFRIEPTKLGFNGLCWDLPVMESGEPV